MMYLTGHSCSGTGTHCPAVAVAGLLLLTQMVFDVAFFSINTVLVEENPAPPVAISLADRVPYGREPVDYFNTDTDDAVTKLGQRLTSGDARLVADERFGYLLSVLQLLDVPLESQLLVYSKTARAPELVRPKTPRAIFFNDEVSVAWIPESRELEITAADPLKGINCYTLSQPLKTSASVTSSETRQDKVPTNDSAPLFQRRTGCLACHAARSSLEVPGLLLRTFQTDRTGKPIVGFSQVTHDMKYEDRWGGWYVTGTPKNLIHQGNLVSEADNTQHRNEPGFASSLSDLAQKFEVDSYPFPASDIVAHLVMAHHSHGTNLLIRAGMESRLDRRSDVESRLLRYFVFADEPPLELSSADAAAVLRGSLFASSFVARGPRDGDGKSLRDLSLDGRVFKHRLSFLIHSRLFDGLPEECRNRLLEKLWQGLTAESADDDFRHLEKHERTQIVSIVRATVPRLPTCWGDGSTARE